MTFSTLSATIVILGSVTSTTALGASLTLTSLIPETSTRLVMDVVANPDATAARSYVLHLNGTIDILNTRADIPTVKGRKLLNNSNKPKGLKQAL